VVKSGLGRRMPRTGRDDRKMAENGRKLKKWPKVDHVVNDRQWMKVDCVVKDRSIRDMVEKVNYR
jgi:hypothetical protein